MKERTKRLQALFCAFAVTATSVGSPLVSVPVYAEEAQGTEDTSEQSETESGKTTDTSDNAISESPDQAEKPVELIPENQNPEPAAEDEGDSSQETTVAAETARTSQAAAVQEAQTQEAETVTPKEGTLTVKVNGTAASGESLEAAVTASGTEAAAVTRLDLVSGTITQADLTYITTLTNLQDFHMQLGSGLKLIGKTGSATTVLGKNTAVLNFAPKASGSSKGALRSVELGGVTEILTGGIVSDSVEIVDLPDATEVGDDAFNGFGWLEKVSLPKAETIGMRAFYKCTRLTNVTLEAVKTLKKDSFYYTNSLKRLTLPATLETIENIQFGRVGQGNKAGTRVVMKGMTPPTVASGAFTGVSQTTISTVTVPAGALDAYLAQINAENSSAGLISKRETMWNNLYLREEGSYAVEYYSEYITGVKVAYVKAGEGVTAEKVASATKAGNIFKGWNTKKNGTGEAFGEGSVPTGDLTVYPVFAASCTVQIHQEDGTTTKLEVEKGQAIGENLPTAPEKEGYVFKEWNTSEDGTGETVTADTVITANMDIYPVYEENLPDVIKVLVNGISVDGSSLDDAIKDSKVAVADVTSIELVSGEITQNDLAYLAQITNLEKFTMHLGEDLILRGKDGNPTTVLGPNSAVLNFAPKAAGSSKGELREVHLEGVTEIQKGGIVSDSVEIVDLPDATEVGDDAFNGFGWLEKVSLPKAETIGMRAFYKCTRLTDVTLEAVKTLKKDSFYYTNSLKRLTLPATLETIENIQFGRVGQGNKAGTRVVMKGMTPPTVASGAFTGVSQTTISTVTVPAGALDAYLAQINAENSSAGLISKRETMWNNLYLREEGSYAVEYYSEYITGVKVAYVKAGEGVTAEKVASATKAGNIFKGWNTKKNGTGEAFGEGSVPTGDLTVYPVFAASCTVQIHQEDGTTTKLEVEKGQAIGENLPTAPEKEGYVFKEWNTSEDGTGETVTADTVITANMDIYPVYEENLPDVIKVLVNGISVDGSSLDDAIKDSKVAVADVTSIELVSGEITQNDLAYLAQITNLEKFTMHLGEDLILRGKDGNPTTVLGPNSAVLNFAPKAAGSSKGELREVHLEGVTEIQKGGIVSDSVEIVDLPDATEVGDDAFNGFGWLEKVSLPKAETIGMRAFYKCTRLTDVTLEAVKTLKKDSFYYTNSLKRLTLPATLETIENIQFGRVGQGNKAGTRVVMKGMTPPTVASGAFTGVSQTTISTVTVPAGALDAYLAQINAENSSAGLISKRETMWNNLYLREEGSYAVEYYSEYITGVKVAYVKAGEGVTAEKVASATKAGNIFKGWNTKKNGTGEAFGEGSVPTGDLTVYPVFAASCTVQIHQEDGTTTKLEVEKGQAIGEKLPTAPEKEGYVFKEWNTSEDGTGETVTADTVITANMDIYPVYEENQPDVIKVLVNGISVDGSSLEDAIKDSKVAVADVTSIELVSGEITQNDLAYLAQITNLEKFTMHLGEDLILHGKDGNPTTVLGPNSAVLNFAPKASGSSKGELREVHLEGVTEIQKGGIVSDSVEIVDLPDATEVGDDAFNGFGWLEKVSLPKAETIGMRAFYKCTRLTDVTLEAVKTLKKDSFYYTNSLKRLTLPATLETIENIQFGKVGQGNKAGTRVVMKGMTPPTVASGAFTGVSQTTISTVTVPAGALDAYLAQINAENSSAGLISKRETMWNNLYLREEGSYAVEYYSEYITGVKVAYVKAGEGVTAEKVASATKAGNIFKGWNTKKNGTGEAFGEGSVPTGDLTVYPVFAASCTVQIHQEDGTTTKLEVEKGQAIGEKLPTAPEKEGYVFKEWNTSEDGTGETVTADTVITANMDIYPVYEENLPDVIKVLVNGISVDGSSLDDAIKDSKVAVADVTSIELVSGEITQNDLAYLAQITNLEKFTMHLGEDLILRGKDGNPTTVLGPNSAVLNFAPKAAGSSKGELREVHLEGVTEIQKGGIVSDSVEIVDLPDATEVGDDAFNGFGWLEKVSLPKAETIGMRAFYKCTRLTDVTLEAVKTLKKDSFYYTNSLKRLTLPATLETIENIQFGRVGQGNKAGTRVVMKGMTPPTVASGAFTGVSQTTISTVTVPAGALDAYLAQINAENSSAGLISKRETMWNNLYLREEGSYAVEYYSEYITGVKVAYVKAGEGVTAEKVASATKAGNIFKGWNTKKNGTGEAFGEGSVPTDDITVYPVFAAACTIQVHQEDGTTTKLEVEKGQAIGEKLPAAPTKEGYLFKGWNTNADGTGTTVTADTVITENMDLYPIFEEDIPPVVEVRVVFDVDGVKSEVKVVKGEAMGSNLPADPMKDGYTFKGWNTKADGTGETVTAETVVTDEMEVYAVFEQNPAPIEEVRVVFDVDGQKSEVKVVKGEAIGSNLPADPTKEGYTFKGWNTKADGTGEAVTAETVVTDEMEVYAVFEQNPAPIEEVRVVFDVDGVKSEVKVIKGEAIGSNLPADPTKEGYTFKGWNTKADGTGETVTAETVVTDEMEVYAVFEQNPAPIEEVKVVIDVDGVKSEVKVIKGEAIGSNLPADPTKEGYTFKGWNTKADGTGETVTADTVVSDDLEVYAIFEKIETPKDPGKGDDTKKPETPTPTPTNTNTTKKNNTTTGTTTPASKTTTTAQTAKTVKTADATPLASTAAAGGLSLLGILAALFGRKKK